MDAANEKRTSVYAAEMKLTHGDLTVDYATVYPDCIPRNS